MCSLDYDEYFSASTERARTARKQHACAVCATSIPVGTAYFVHTYVFERTATTEKACFACWWSWSVFRDAHGVYPALSGFHQELLNCIGENDDEEDVWRPHLAALLKRWRVSPQRRAKLAESRAS